MLITNFIEVFDFDTSWLKPYKEDMVNQYFKTIDVIDGNNTPYKNNEIEKSLSFRFEKTIKDNFIVTRNIKEIKPWIYVQNNKHTLNQWHNHINSATLNATLYLDPPKDGGELCFIYPDNLQENIEDTYIKIKPEENKLYVFPSWIMHKPLPQKDKKYRVCINLEWYCKQRPISKESFKVW